ncbi:MAG: glycosyltransferase family 4 protein [Bacteroidales bacterium]|nr:glycosyltransferase family 4 protein [Bacteroidales bacterium]
MTKVLVVATSRKTRGGITAVLKLYEQSPMWQQYHCHWIGTHRDGGIVRKLWYLTTAFIQYCTLLPFFNIVHIHFSLRTSAKRKYPFFKLAKIFKKKTIIHLHCGSQIDEIWNDTYQKMFEQCDCGILLSESLKHKIEKRIGKSDKLTVIYNPCSIIKETNKQNKINYILFSGTLYEGKGYKDFICAFAKIASNHSGWNIVLAGNGEEEQARKLSKDLGIESQVKLLGWVNGEQKHQAFSEATAFCLPSYAEGFPMAVLDAWAYGLPVITTPVGGIPDVAIDGKNMLLFEPGDVDSLAKKLETIITDNNLRIKLSEESKKLAEGMFSLEAVTQQVRGVYDSLM